MTSVRLRRSETVVRIHQKIRYIAAKTAPQCVSELVQQELRASETAYATVRSRSRADLPQHSQRLAIA